MKMIEATIDQLLFVAVHIHDWERNSLDIVKRSIDIVHECGLAIQAQEEVTDMEARGLSTTDMLRDALRERFGAELGDLTNMTSAELREAAKKALRGSRVGDA